MLCWEKPFLPNRYARHLENIHDGAYLQNLPLTTELSGTGRTLDQAMRHLRAELLAAIDSLKPLGSISPRSREARPYALMYGRYVQCVTTADMVDELAISVRQLRREHKRALDGLIELLWTRLSGQLVASDPTASGKERGAVEAEADQLIRRARAEDLDLARLLHGILATLAPVAASRGVAFDLRLPDGLAPVYADRIVLRQSLFELFAHAIGRAGGHRVTVDGAAGGDTMLEIRAAGAPMPGLPEQERPVAVSLDVSRQLIASLGGEVIIREGTDYWQASVRLPHAVDTPILIMDDNAGLVELFRRYLAGGHYRVIEARTAGQALQEVRQANPGLIILDVMMPEQDGWEILQHLRSVPEAAGTPILICSVLHEPEIAYALGASDYLAKPVTRDDLLAKVEQWCNVRPAPAAPRRAAPADNAVSRLA